MPRTITCDPKGSQRLGEGKGKKKLTGQSRLRGMDNKFTDKTEITSREHRILGIVLKYGTRRLFPHGQAQPFRGTFIRGLL